MNKTTVAIIMLVVGQIFWGGSYLISGYALEVFPAATLVAIRIGIAAIILGLIGLATKKLQRLKLKDVPFFFLAAFAEPFVYFLCEAEALHRVSPTIASVMLSLIPLLTPLFALIFLKEKVRFLNVLGIMLSIAGVMMIIMEGGEVSADLVGIGLLMIGVFAAITYTLVLKKIPETYNTITVVFYMFCASLMFFIPTAIIKESAEFMAIDWSLPETTKAFWAIVGLAITASCIAFMFFSHGVRVLGPTKANVFNNIQPGVTAILSMVILNEAMPAVKIMGIGIVILGMFVSQMKQKRYLK